MDTATEGEFVIVKRVRRKRQKTEEVKATAPPLWNLFDKAPTAILKYCLSFLCYAFASRLVLGLKNRAFRRLMTQARPDHVLQDAPMISVLLTKPDLLNRTVALRMADNYRRDRVRDMIIPGVLHKSIRSFIYPPSENHFCDIPNIETVVLSCIIGGPMNWESGVWKRLKRIGFGYYEIPDDVVFSDCTDIFVPYTSKFDSRQFPKLKRVFTSGIFDVARRRLLDVGVEITTLYDGSVSCTILSMSKSTRIVCSRDIPKGFKTLSAKEIVIAAWYDFDCCSLRNLPKTLKSLQLRGVHPDNISDYIRCVSQTLVGLCNFVVTTCVTDCRSDCIAIPDEIGNLRNLETVHFPFLHDQAHVRELLPRTMFLEADPYDDWWY